MAENLSKCLKTFIFGERMGQSVSVCVCVRERERQTEKEREPERHRETPNLTFPMLS